MSLTDQNGPKPIRHCLARLRRLGLERLEQRTLFATGMLAVDYLAPGIDERLATEALEFDERQITDVNARLPRSLPGTAELPDDGYRATVVVEITDAAGNVVPWVRVGDEFRLRARLLVPQGTDPFSGYTDVRFTPGLFLPLMNKTDVGHNQSSIRDDEVDEAGWCMYMSQEPSTIFTKTFRATAAGIATFTANAPDIVYHEVLYTGLTEILDLSLVSFGSTQLIIVPAGADFEMPYEPTPATVPPANQETPEILPATQIPLSAVLSDNSESIDFVGPEISNPNLQDPTGYIDWVPVWQQDFFMRPVLIQDAFQILQENVHPRSSPVNESSESIDQTANLAVLFATYEAGQKLSTRTSIIKDDSILHHDDDHHPGNVLELLCAATITTATLRNDANHPSDSTQPTHLIELQLTLTELESISGI